MVREYRGQFATNSTQDYQLSGLDVSAGAAGRASGRYVASRSGAGPITGQIVLGVRRERGRPRIALIAVNPAADEQVLETYGRTRRAGFGESGWREKT